MIGNRYDFGNEMYDTVATAIELLNEGAVPEMSAWEPLRSWQVSGESKRDCSQEGASFGMYINPQERKGEISIFTMDRKALETFANRMDEFFGIDLRKLNIKPAVKVIAEIGYR